VRDLAARDAAAGIDEVVGLDARGDVDEALGAQEERLTGLARPEVQLDRRAERVVAAPADPHLRAGRPPLASKPSAQPRASISVDLPAPFSPTTKVTGASNRSGRRSGRRATPEA